MLHSSLHVSSEIPFSDSCPFCSACLQIFFGSRIPPNFPYAKEIRESLYFLFFFTLCYFQNSASTKKSSPHLQKTAIRRLPRSRKKLSEPPWKGRVLLDSLRLVPVRLPLSSSRSFRNSMRTSENLRLSCSHRLVNLLCRSEKSSTSSLLEPISVL